MAASIDYSNIMYVNVSSAFRILVNRLEIQYIEFTRILDAMIYTCITFHLYSHRNFVWSSSYTKHTTLKELWSETFRQKVFEMRRVKKNYVDKKFKYVDIQMWKFVLHIHLLIGAVSTNREYMYIPIVYLHERKYLSLFRFQGAYISLF